MKKLMIALMVAGAFAVGCGDKASGSGAAAGSDSVGVAECDDYLKKMDACFAKDAASKAAMEPGLKTTRDSWKQMAASGGAAKDGLKQACSAAAAGIPANCK
jgi:hypothetical protein